MTQHQQPSKPPALPGEQDCPHTNLTLRRMLGDRDAVLRRLEQRIQVLERELALAQHRASQNSAVEPSPPAEAAVVAEEGSILLQHRHDTPVDDRPTPSERPRSGKKASAKCTACRQSVRYCTCYDDQPASD